MAATILYRALLDDILTRARSKAYGHGATCLGNWPCLRKMPMPPASANSQATPHILPNSNRRTTGKSGFWARVGEG
ncbi:DUF6880 family protein [Antarctobacter heliothermus]|uniref:DUF6880 family protein n=1 Tax=Antarctobacter heliothermus TaxID=74033 RepID=UPI0034A0CD64